MKKIVYFVVILVGLSVTYYFGIFLPKMHNFEMQERCAKLAQEFFDKQGYVLADHADYQCHYNRKLNKCFILITTDVFLDNSTTEIQEYTLKDILDNKYYGGYREETGLQVGFPTPYYIMDDKKCSSTEWHKRLKQYMEN